MQILPNTEAGVDAVLSRVGKRILLATPLAIGKPNHLLNALYRRAKADPTLELTIHTALSLIRPSISGELERRFMGPLFERVFGDYPDLDYELDRQRNALPENVRVIEFYFLAGRETHVASAQRDYISTNYTHVARDLLARGVNVVMQQVCAGVDAGRPRLSLSCNPDLTLDIAQGLRTRAARGQAAVSVAQINDRLPFMYGSASVAPDYFDYVVDDPAQYCDLFAPPKVPIDDAETMIGVYGSALVRDGGELQVGIGALGDALVYALTLRQRDNRQYTDALATLRVRDRFATELDRIGQTARFEQGLFAASEMLVDGFMQLWQAGILKRKVYDDLSLSRLRNEGRIDERVSPELLDLLQARKAIHRVLTEEDFDYLVHFGILRSELRFEAGQVVSPDGLRCVPDLAEPAARQQLERWLGSELQHGAVIHAGFFLGPRAFYDWLRDLPEAERRLIDMRSVTSINQLYGHEELDRLHRRDARFVNTCLKMSLLGAATSDALADGTVVSGVGGQYNFVAMAHELPGGRSILQLRSTRLEHGRLASNMVWNYGHTTIPRHLRDVVITEYGVADLRGKTDEECVQALLPLCDSRFQEDLVRDAKRANKLRPGYVIPDAHRNNQPQAYAVPLAELRRQGLFPNFPFGTDLTADEQDLAKALRRLAHLRAAPLDLLRLAPAAIGGEDDARFEPLLRRMDLQHPRNAKEHVYRRLLLAALQAP
jgi:acyl-CoA hydrolase